MKRLKYLLGFCLVVSSLALADDPIQPQFKGADAQAVDNAKSLRLAHRYDDSIDLLLPIVKREPKYYRAMYQLALACAERAQSPARQPKDVENADKWFKLAIAEKERLAAAGTPLDEYTIYNSYGWFLIENGRFMDAEASLLKGVNELDKLPSVQSRQRVLNNLSLVYKQQRRFAEAEAMSKRAVALGSVTAQKNLTEIQQMARSKK
jgi:Tfp pilus assembly protein PilF